MTDKQKDLLREYVDQEYADWAAVGQEGGKMGKHPPLLLAIEAALKEVEEVKVFRQSKRDCMRSLVRLQKAFIARGMVGTEDEFVLLRDAIKGLSVGELQIIAMDVFSRPECVFNYCPHPEYCSTECQSPGDPQ